MSYVSELASVVSICASGGSAEGKRVRRRRPRNLADPVKASLEGLRVIDRGESCVFLSSSQRRPPGYVFRSQICSVQSGDIEAREKGSLIAHEDGFATPFGITGAQSRGVLMVSPKDDIYRDMIVGMHQRPGDLRVNICKVRTLMTDCSQYSQLR